MEQVTLDGNLKDIVEKLSELKDVFWKYAIIILSLVIVIWGVYIGIKIITAHKNDEKINAKSMLKNLLIGVVVIFVIAVGAPLLIDGLKSWVSSGMPNTEGFKLFNNI